MQHTHGAGSLRGHRARRGVTAALSAALGLAVLGAPATAPSADAEALPEFFRVLTTQVNEGAAFGTAVAADDDYAVIGAPGFADGRGLVFIGQFMPDRRVAIVGALAASDGQAGNQFGSSVAIDGSTIVVGAYAANGDAGAVYVFTRPAGGWSGYLNEAATLTAANSELLGYSVDVSGGTVVAGDYRTEGVRGAVRVYTRPLLGWQDDATPTQTMRASDGRVSDQLGKAVSVDGNTVVAGAEGSNGRGAAYVFVRSSGIPGVWPASQTAKLTTSNGAVGDHTGAAVDIDGATIAVGAPRWGTDGAAFLYGRPVAGWRDATQTARLTAPGDFVNSAFTGVAVDVASDGRSVLVGAEGIGQRGGVMHFTKPGGGWTSTDRTTWQIAPDGQPFAKVSRAIAATADHVLLGDPHSNAVPGRGGEVLVYGFPAFTSAPLRLGFPDTATGTTSQTKTVTISNPGSAALSTVVEITGAGRDDFAVADHSCAQAVPPGNTCTVSVAFAPRSVGQHTAFLQFSDRADGSPHRIPLSGSGTAGPGPGPGPGPGVRPSPPTDLTVVPKRKKLKARWRAGANAVDYRVTVRGKRPKLARTATTAKLRHAVKTLRPGKRYTVCVRSHNAVGLSAKACVRTRTTR